MPRRQPLLDAQKQSELCAILAVGGTRRIAARYVGCCVDTIRRTAARDPVFREKLEKAESKHEILHLKSINDAARSKQYWRAAAWMLERKYPQRYQERRSGALTADQLAQVLARFAEIVCEEVPTAKYRQRILDRLDGLIAGLNLPPPHSTSG